MRSAASTRVYQCGGPSRARDSTSQGHDSLLLLLWWRFDNAIAARSSLETGAAAVFFFSLGRSLGRWVCFSVAISATRQSNSQRPSLDDVVQRVVRMKRPPAPVVSSLGGYKSVIPRLHTAARVVVVEEVKDVEDDDNAARSSLETGAAAVFFFSLGRSLGRWVCFSVAISATRQSNSQRPSLDDVVQRVVRMKRPPAPVVSSLGKSSGQ